MHAVTMKNGKARQQVITEVMEAADTFLDFYALFGLELFSGKENDNEFEERVRRAYRQMAFQFHPDKNLDQDPANCKAMMHLLSHVRTVLLDEDLKRRYDQELRRQIGQEGLWDAWKPCFRWMGILTLAGIGGFFLLPVPWIGSAFLCAAVRGACKQYEDPDQSNLDFCQELFIGSVQGAAGALVSSGVFGVVACQMLSAPIVGATSAVAINLIDDGSDLIRGREVSWDVQEYIRTAGIGALAGFLVHIIGSALDRGALADSCIDDVAAVFRTNGLKHAGKHAGRSFISSLQDATALKLASWDQDLRLKDLARAEAAQLLYGYRKGTTTQMLAILQMICALLQQAGVHLPEDHLSRSLFWQAGRIHDCRYTCRLPGQRQGLTR